MKKSTCHSFLLLAMIFCLMKRNLWSYSLTGAFSITKHTKHFIRRPFSCVCFRISPLPNLLNSIQESLSELPTLKWTNISPPFGPEEKSSSTLPWKLAWCSTPPPCCSFACHLVGQMMENRISHLLITIRTAQWWLEDEFLHVLGVE